MDHSFLGRTEAEQIEKLQAAYGSQAATKAELDAVPLADIQTLVTGWAATIADPAIIWNEQITSMLGAMADLLSFPPACCKQPPAAGKMVSEAGAVPHLLKAASEGDERSDPLRAQARGPLCFLLCFWCFCWVFFRCRYLLWCCRCILLCCILLCRCLLLCCCHWC